MKVTKNVKTTIITLVILAAFGLFLLVASQFPEAIFLVLIVGIVIVLWDFVDEATS